MKHILKPLILLIFIISSHLSFAQNNKQQTFNISKNLNIFNSVMRELDMLYVDTLNHDKMMKNTIDDMLKKLDPYTVYMPEEETDDLKFMTTGEYAGIGAIISQNGNEICISEPYEGMPAQKNDVRAGDVILEIDGKSIKNLSVSEVSNMLRGTPNTTISLKLKRFGEKKPIEKTFLREKIHVNPIGYATVVGNKTGYILLNDFTERSAIEFRNTVNDLVKTHKIESLIIDLRNNGGGLIDEAVKMVGYFVAKGTEVVSTKGKNEFVERTYKTPTEPLFPDMKLMVLVNRSSASASEILAGAVQDLDRGVIVGERTFGKGLVQNIRPLNFGGHLKVTTAKYYIPSGRCIQAIDYAHRNEDGSADRLSDSLTSEFKTRNGRIVRDGGGIIPDKVIKDDRTLNIAYYIYMQNHYFDFATQYASQNPNIATPDKFELSNDEFKAFTQYLLNDKKFTYTSQTEKYFDELQEFAKVEGLDKVAQEEFLALKKKLVPDIAQNLENNKEDILELLSLEIIKRYYFQKGVVQYSLRADKDLELALEILNSGEYETIITKK